MRPHTHPIPPERWLIVETLPKLPPMTTHPHGIIGAVVEYLDPELYAAHYGAADDGTAPETEED